MPPMLVDTIVSVDIDRVLAQLEAGRAATRRRDQETLVSVTIRLPNVDPLAVFHRGAEFDTERRFWSAPGGAFTIVGLGQSWTMELSGSNRFAVASEAWRTCCAGAVIDVPVDSEVTGPVLLAGFSFDPERDSTEVWADFPAGLLVLPRFAVTVIGDRSWLTVNAVLDPDSEPNTLRSSVEAVSAMLGQATKTIEVPPQRTDILPVDVVPASDWQALVGETTRRLSEGDAEKIVLALSTRLTAEARFNPTPALKNLLTNYPNCYVFAVDRGDSCFLGASPEQLALVDGRTVRTVCLAGSTSRGRTIEEDRLLGEALLNSSKNRSEHAIVVRWVRDTLSTAGIDLVEGIAPTLLKFQNVQHLYTPVEGQLPDGRTVLDLVAHLHPTPSVGGQPRETALAYLREHEGLDRGWYAGAVGWVDAYGQGEFAVAIRSALIRGRTAVLFAGCGVVPDSVPEQEYAEARMKLRPMLTALGASLG